MTTSGTTTQTRTDHDEFEAALADLHSLADDVISRLTPDTLIYPFGPTIEQQMILDLDTDALVAVMAEWP